MKKLFLTASLATGMAITALHAAENVKKLHFLQDDAQEPFVSKVFELKHIRANDLTPFVLGAINRYNTNSKIDRVKYNGVHSLIVSTPPDMMPYVEDMIAKLDRPCAKTDPSGSIVQGTGISRFSFAPKHRSSRELVDLVNYMLSSPDGYAYFDSASNMVYWKDSLSDGSYTGFWMKSFDRPLPQVELTFKIYEVRDSDLNDIGVDYLAWKNGPGLNVLSVGMESLTLDTVEKAFSNMDQFSSYAYGGFFTAPQFDMSFVRMLSQKGAAKIATTASLTVMNNYNGSYYVTLSPGSQNLVKDSSDRMSVVTGATNTSKLTVVNPVICYKRTGERDTIYDGFLSDMTTYAQLDGTIQFRYTIEMKDVVERNNRGDELTEQNYLQSSLTLDLGNEHLLAVCKKDQQVEQVIGVPFLADVPYLKYLFSTTTKINEQSKLFVTVQGRLVHPEDKYAAWTGKLVKPEEINGNANASINANVNANGKGK